MISKLKNFLFGSLSRNADEFYNGEGQFTIPAVGTSSPLPLGGGGIDRFGSSNVLSGTWEYIYSFTGTWFLGDVAIPHKYQEIMVICRKITKSLSGIIYLRVSVDGGANFLEGANDYFTIDQTGAENAGNTAVTVHNTSTTNARSGVVFISGLNFAGGQGGYKIAFNPYGGANLVTLIPSINDHITHIRIMNSAYSAPATGSLTAASGDGVSVYGR